MTLTKNKIVDAIQSNLEAEDFTRNKSSRVLEDLLNLIKRTLESGEDIMISGFGKFCVNEKKERRGRNPATDEKMMLPPRKVVTFKCSGKLRDRVNE